jgi:peptide/nickel transport system substrate-binding protein
MGDNSYWTQRRLRVSRRQVLRTSLAGAGVAGLTAMGCSTRGSQTAKSTSGASTSAASGPPVQGGQFTAYLAANPQSLDPQRVSATAQVSISGVMSRLFKFKTGTDPKVTLDHNLDPDLGVSAESPDGITWTVKIRPDAKFQNIAPVNGHAVESDDIKATFVRSQDPKNPNAANLAMIDTTQIETPDKTTVVFKLKKPYSPFRELLGSPTYAWIFPREALDGSYDPVKVAIGSGPYTLESAQPDVAYTYKRWDGYWDKSLGHVDTVKLAIVPDVQQQIAQLAAGNIDEAIFATPDDVAAAQQRAPKATLIKGENATPSPMYFQMGDPSSIFQDIRVRRAFSLAMDRETIGKVVYNGQYETMVFVPSYMGKQALRLQDLSADAAQWYKYNPSDSKKLLDEAGLKDLSLKFVYLYGNPTPGSFGSPQWNKLCDTVSNMLNQIGVKTTAVQQDYAKDYVDAGKGSRQGYFDKDWIVFAGIAPATDGYEIIFNHMDSRSTSNAEHLKDPMLDGMLDKSLTIVNEGDRLKALLDIQRYLADKMYVVPTVGTYQYVMVAPRVQNYQYTNPRLGAGTETWAKLWVNGAS